jgi:hypothetical protein
MKKLLPRDEIDRSFEPREDQDHVQSLVYRWLMENHFGDRFSPQNAIFDEAELLWRVDVWLVWPNLSWAKDGVELLYNDAKAFATYVGDVFIDAYGNITLEHDIEEFRARAKRKASLLFERSKLFDERLKTLNEIREKVPDLDHR